MSRGLGVSVILVLCAASSPAQDPLPRVQAAEWEPIRASCQRLAVGLRRLEVLPADVDTRLTALLKENARDADAALEKLQDLLDPLCLVGVHINPESRVKAARGPLSGDLTVGRPRVVLVKVQNDGGITAPLNVVVEGGWLEAAAAPAPLTTKLTGAKLEYVALLLTAREAGKREATLKFDAGQGTQDLGFRAEVPILFRVKS